MKKGRNIFWGLIFILGALALLVGKMGVFGDIGFWNIFFSIALIGGLLDGIWHRSFGMALFSLAFLIIVNNKLLGLEAITPWPVLGAALFGTIGMNFLFPNRKWKNGNFHSGYGHHRWKGKQEDTAWEESESHKGDEMSLDGGEVWFANSFGEAVKYLTGGEINKVHLKNSFGSLSIYFDNAVLKSGRAEVSVHNSFGSTVLYVPGDWKVELDVDTAFGDADETGRCNPSGSNTLLVHGSVSFGELEIRYI